MSGMGRSAGSLTIQTSPPGDRVCFAGDRALLVIFQALPSAAGWEISGVRPPPPPRDVWSRAGLPELDSEHPNTTPHGPHEETTNGQGSVQPTEVL